MKYLHVGNFPSEPDEYQLGNYQPDLPPVWAIFDGNNLHCLVDSVQDLLPHEQELLSSGAFTARFLGTDCSVLTT